MQAGHAPSVVSGAPQVVQRSSVGVEGMPDLRLLSFLQLNRLKVTGVRIESHPGLP